MGLADIPEPPKTVTVEVKPWWKSKTLWAGILIALAGAGDALAGSAVLDSTTADLVVTAIGIVKIILRKFTTAPIG